MTDSKRILIVEDNERHAELMEKVLTNADKGFTTDVASNMGEAWGVLSEHMPDMILLDYQLPDGNGLDLLKEISDQKPLPIPVIVMTSYGTEDIAVDAMKSGALDYIVKSPETFNDLDRIICKNLDNWINKSEKIRMQQELKAQKEFTASVLQTTQALIVVMKTDGEVVSVNTSFTKLTGYGLDDVKGRNFFELLIPESDVKKEKAMIKELQGVELQNVSHTPHITRSESTKDIEWYNTKVYDDNGDIRWIIKTGIDISERNKLEQQLLKAQKLEAVGTLSVGIAHDFNNILQAILCYSQTMIRNYKDNSEEYYKLMKIEECVKRAGDLTRQLLTFGSKIQPDKRMIDVNGEIRMAKALLQRTIPKMVDIRTELTEDMTKILADPNQIQQIIINLCVNSNDALPDGGSILINTSSETITEETRKMHPNARPGEYLKISIKDDGKGMNSEELEHIFDPFFTSKDMGHGSGLGLAVVYGIIKNHDGFISTSSIPGKGTEVAVYLPVPEMEEEQVPCEIDEIVPAASDGETILLVEDDHLLRQLGHDMLKLNGYNIVTAENGEEALEFYNKNWKDVDLVILDLIMPGMGGKKCLGKMRKINKEAKVLVTSGMAFDKPQKDVMKAGASGFITKPYEMRQIVEVVRKTIAEAVASG
jgi:PAS domain S-box-containing protein